VEFLNKIKKPFFKMGNEESKPKSYGRGHKSHETVNINRTSPVVENFFKVFIL